VVDGVKSRGKVEEDEEHGLYFTNGADDLVLDAKEGGFGTVPWSVGRLTRFHESVVAEVTGELRCDSSLNEFGYK
jgi:hypothetical protein